MAQIVLGMAVPHSGMLGRAPEGWPEDGDRDRRKGQERTLWFRNQCWTFEELKAHRANEHLETQMTLEERTRRHERTNRAMDVLRRVYQENKLDVAIILGKDQKEMFIDVSPSLAIFMGDSIENGPPQRAVYAPDHPVTYPAHPQLAQHLIKSFQRDGFDMTEILSWPPNTWQQNKPIAPHAYGFVYHQIMRDEVPPNVPVFLNCFYPPNQPSMARALSLGKSLFEAIKAWDSDKKVAIIASGGLSHFVCDEKLDAKFLEYFAASDFDALTAVDDRSYQSGTSEVKLYVPILWAMSQLGCRMQLVDYVPCYRTEAGTGEGFGFMYWTPNKA